jgi:hypothetical protein
MWFTVTSGEGEVTPRRATCASSFQANDGRSCGTFAFSFVAKNLETTVFLPRPRQDEHARTTIGRS